MPKKQTQTSARKTKLPVLLMRRHKKLILVIVALATLATVTVFALTHYFVHDSITGCRMELALDENGDRLVSCVGTVGDVIQDSRGTDGDAVFILKTTGPNQVRVSIPGGLSLCVAGLSYDPKVGQKISVRGIQYEDGLIGVCSSKTYVRVLK